ncbi:MAG: hypothetical protein AUI01_08630 [Ktedonobacter sp. 13_2_20CM_2_56_8]|nr:MAG: hypothetical protein AUH05_17435 [Ktedonobacter sp. 13_2_20CM_53_11]OLB55103.1 MAG: hypothetical protein AUI01_08630 [Ktedonobacter sp. 13_2_20CM_2_56_8]
MSGVLYFVLFVLVIVIIVAITNQIAYKQRRITRSEARFRQLFALFACILSVIFAIIAAYFHISILFVFLGFVLLIIVIGALAYFVFRRKL